MNQSEGKEHLDKKWEKWRLSAKKREDRLRHFIKTGEYINPNDDKD